MKVLYVTNLPAPYKITFFELLSKEVDLTVVYERKKASDRDDKWKKESSNTFREIYLAGKEIGNEASLDIGIVRLLKGYDLVVMNGYSSPTAMIAITYMRLLRIKYVIACDSMLPTVDTSLKKGLKKWLIGGANGWLSSGKITTEQLVQYGASLDGIVEYPFSSVSEKDIVSLPIDKDYYKKAIGCEGKKVALFVGQFIHRKGIDILLNAANELREIEFVLVGGTADLVKGMANCDAPNVKYAGFKTKEELADYYKAADIFVLPTREDIWGLVVNEAMAYGLPVITTDRCGAGLELINPDNGMIVPAGEVEALHAALAKVANMNLSDMGKSALKKIRYYTIENMVHEHIDFLEAYGEQ